jgi:peptidoglycan/LPS O-acetylase OafA/YrhL
MASKQRLIFANQLRGLAALAVVAGHLIGVFWSEPGQIGVATASPPISGTPPALFALVGQPWCNPSVVGVAVFFLISGLVIPISLARHTTQSFLLARALRIYPTAILALILEIATIHANAAYWHLPMPFGRGGILSNFLLIYDLIGRGSIDLVNWTLCIELKFYLLMAALAGPIQRGRLAPLFFSAVAIEAGNLLYAQFDFAAPAFAPIRMLSLESVMIVFMLIGVLFNYHHRGLLGLRGLLLSIAAMLAIFAISWLGSVLQADFLVTPLYYLEGLGVFGLAYALRRHAVRIPVLDWLAAISFPLYLIHLVIGISLMKWLMLGAEMPYLWSLATSLGVSVLLATLLHLGIERRSTEWGSRLATAVPAI